jgi:hypothetical protein
MRAFIVDRGLVRIPAGIMDSCSPTATGGIGLCHLCLPQTLTLYGRFPIPCTADQTFLVNVKISKEAY